LQAARTLERITFSPSAQAATFLLGHTCVAQEGLKTIPFHSVRWGTVLLDHIYVAAKTFGDITFPTSVWAATFLLGHTCVAARALEDNTFSQRSWERSFT
jgi:hypothetical protein